MIYGLHFIYSPSLIEKIENVQLVLKAALDGLILGVFFYHFKEVWLEKEQVQSMQGQKEIQSTDYYYTYTEK